MMRDYTLTVLDGSCASPTSVDDDVMLVERERDDVGTASGNTDAGRYSISTLKSMVLSESWALASGQQTFNGPSQ